MMMVRAVLCFVLGSAVVQASDYFTYVVLPDTQKYSESYPDTYHAQTQWIADNAIAENIVFVSHVGDIVENGGYGENNNALEWLVADAAMSRMDGHVPWGVVMGNHDFDNWYQPYDGSQNYLAHFGPQRFAGESYWGGASADGYNSYQFFEAGGRRFMTLHLMVDVPPSSVTWAQQVLDAHPNTPATISTHIYLKENGRTRFSYMVLYDPTWVGLSGNDVYAQLVSPNPQLFMVNCGHIAYERFQVSVNSNGQEVFELLQDYQLRSNGGEGYMRLFRFYEDEGYIHARTYSPVLDAFETDADSDFIINVDFFERFGPKLADFDADDDVDAVDFAGFAGCMTTSDETLQLPGCENKDLDRDEDADVRDFAKVQRQAY